MADPYDTLGVPRDADADAIKAAYRRRARDAHPDRHGGDHDEMADINDAYAILSSPERRERFDQSGETDKLPPRDRRARDTVLQAMATALDSGRDDVDLVKVLRAQLQVAQSNLKANSSQARRQLTVTERQHKRIRDDGGLFAGLFKQRMVNLKRAMADMAEQIEVLDLAQDLLNDVEWIADERDSPQGQLGRTFGWTQA